MRWSRSHAAGVSRNGSRPILADHSGPGNRFLAPPIRPASAMPASAIPASNAFLAAASVAGQRRRPALRRREARRRRDERHRRAGPGAGTGQARPRGPAGGGVLRRARDAGPRVDHRGHARAQDHHLWPPPRGRGAPAGGGRGHGRIVEARDAEGWIPGGRRQNRGPPASRRPAWPGAPAPPKETTVDDSIAPMDQDLTCAAQRTRYRGGTGGPTEGGQSDQRSPHDPATGDEHADPGRRGCSRPAARSDPRAASGLAEEVERGVTNRKVRRRARRRDSI
jgi:hypothetical protein